LRIKWKFIVVHVMRMLNMQLGIKTRITLSHVIIFFNLRAFEGQGACHMDLQD